MAEKQQKEEPVRREQTAQQQQTPPPKEQESHQQQPPPATSCPPPPQIALQKADSPEAPSRSPPSPPPSPPLALQPPPPPRTKAQAVPQGPTPHHRLAQRRASDVIDSGGSSPMGSPGAGAFFGSLPRELASRTPLPSPSSPRSPASDRGYVGSAFNSPVTPVRDATDAAPVNSLPAQAPEPTFPVAPEAAMPVERDADEYNMRHRRRGHAVIFNNDEFQMGMAARAGSEVDVKNLRASFEALQFEVEVHENKEYGEIRDLIQNLAAEDHSDADCIAIAVLTHGMANGYLLARDVPYPVHTLWQPFTADKCLTLAGKPKLFFIQACRGEQLDAGVTLKRRSRTETDSGRSSYKIPSHTDFLLAYSAPEGFFSWRNPENGTWFIQCLCQELNANAQSMDMLKMLTRVARRVALDHESFNDLVPWENQCKQVPSFTSMLIRDLIFHPKV